MLKKATLSSAYSGLQCCSISAPRTSPSVQASPDRRPSVNGPSQRRQCRLYATVRPSKGYDFRDNMNWPCRASHPAVPTPYEIFELDKGAVYSKHKYYELVKIYHPDTHANGLGHTLPHGERLERYRLVVQAHEILSDPVKRKAYDAYGAGWGEQGRAANRHSRGHYSPDGMMYGHGPEHDSSPFGNATWEDWERWYRRHGNPADGTKQAYAGTYLNPNAFASFIILLAVISGVAQATRAGQYSGSLEASAQAFSEETSRFLSSRKENPVENPGADGRIKAFLEKRDPSRYGLKDEEEETYRRHFSSEKSVPPALKRNPSRQNDAADSSKLAQPSVADV